MARELRKTVDRTFRCLDEDGFLFTGKMEYVGHDADVIMEPGVDARSLRFSPLFTRVLGVLTGLTISFSERRYLQRASSAR